MNPLELVETVKNILESVDNQNRAVEAFHQTLQSAGTKKNKNGTHTFDGSSETHNKIHHALTKAGYEHDQTLGEYNKPVGKTFHVVKIKNKTVTQRFL